MIDFTPKSRPRTNPTEREKAAIKKATEKVFKKYHHTVLRELLAGYPHYSEDPSLLSVINWKYHYHQIPPYYAQQIERLGLGFTLKQLRPDVWRVFGGDK